MPEEKYHIIITGDQGEGRAFSINKKTARLASVILAVVSLLLFVCSVTGITLFGRNLSLSAKNRNLDAQLNETMTVLDQVQADRSKTIARYEHDITRLEQEREELLKDSISRLDEKSKVIEKVMDYIGVEVKVEEDPGHSGGPFVFPAEEYGDRLILKADRYLEVLNKIPLGRPVPGKISSKFGSRTDPIKKRKAHHPGIDFRGHTGDPVKATAEGTVKTSSHNGVLGNHVIIDHGNGYETIFAHLSKRLVKKKEKVKRGQVIGHIGNTGRSTGSHLHYGIRYRNKSIDPMKYLQVADLSLSITQ